MVSHWSLNDSKSPQVFRTLLSIVTDLNNTLDWMISICLPISNSYSPLSKPLGQFELPQLQLVSLSPSWFKIFLVLWPGLGNCVSLYFLWFSVCVPRWQKIYLTTNSLFVVTSSKSGILIKIRSFVCISICQGSLSITILADHNHAVVWLVSIFLRFPTLPDLFQAFVNRSKRPNYNWYPCHLHASQRFHFSSKV